ncbi:MAG: hypothetical protein ACLUW6_02300 [Coriobacteriaceae bacterium]
MGIHASAITCYLYEKEFDGRDIVDDFVAMGEVPNFGVLRRCLWAMMKTASPATVPGYAAWMNSTADIDYQWRLDGGVTREVKDAFFEEPPKLRRGRASSGQATKLQNTAMVLGAFHGLSMDDLYWMSLGGS